jgi:hypothetical protein
VRLDQRDARTAPREQDRGRAAGDARADDGDVEVLSWGGGDGLILDHGLVS